MEKIKDLRLGKYDVLVGINLLREGLDLPEVSLIAILDADKEGFLRSETSLIQTIGRAARNVDGRVIMYADKITGSMERALKETNRRREIQDKFNKENNITPKSIIKSIRDDITVTIAAENKGEYLDMDLGDTVDLEDLQNIVIKMEEEMYKAAEALEFERAASLRDQINKLKKEY